MKAAIVTDVADTGASTTQDFTLSGFGTPVGYIIFSARVLTDGTTVIHQVSSEGMCDGTNQFCSFNKAEHGVGTSDCNRQQSSDRVVSLYNPATESLIAEATHDSFITDGIRIDWSTVPVSAFRMQILLLGGPDLQVEVAQHDFARQSNGDTDAVVLDGAFQPDMVIFMGGHTVDETFVTHSKRGLGASTPNADACVSLLSRNGISVATNTISNWEIHSNLRYGNSSDGAFQHALNLTSMNSDGFTMNKTFVEGDGSMIIGYMALQSDTNEMYVQNVASPTSTGVQATALPGTEMKPQCVLIATSAMDTVDTEYAAGDGQIAAAWGISLFDDQRQSSFTFLDLDAADPMDTASQYDDSAVHSIGADNTVLHDAQFHSFEPGQFKLNYATANGTARRWVVIAFESNERNNSISMTP